MMDLAPNDRARDIIRVLVSSGDVGRPYIVTQEVPVNRINILRQAFGKAVKDPDFIADATKQRLPVSPKVGDQAAQTVEAIYATPDDVVAEARKIITQ
jgi:hypothetical protein